MLSCGKDKFSQEFSTPLKGLNPSPLPMLGPLGLGSPASETVSPETASTRAVLWVRAIPAPSGLPPFPPSPRLSFNNLGIQCVRKKEIEAAIERKIQLGIDPYNGESPRLAPASCPLRPLAPSATPVPSPSPVSAITTAPSLPCPPSPTRVSTPHTQPSHISPAAGSLKNHQEVDMNVVRICFQASYRDQQGQMRRMDPVLSEPVYDKSESRVLFH